MDFEAILRQLLNDIESADDFMDTFFADPEDFTLFRDKVFEARDKAEMALSILKLEAV